MSVATLSTLLVLLALAGLLVAEKSGSRTGVWITKPLAATGYLAVAIACGALDSRYGVLVLTALVLCWFGDVLLILRNSQSAFRAGILAFLLGHVAFTIAFAQRGIAGAASIITLLIAVAVAIPVLRWLVPHVESSMRVPVYAYVVVISSMLVFATGTSVAGGRYDILAGALLFYLSDLSVARDRFVSPGFINAAWGLPFYFIGQLILAWSVR
jgi:uncharacterized membrane protein YhhN